MRLYALMWLLAAWRTIRPAVVFSKDARHYYVAGDGDFWLSVLAYQGPAPVEAGNRLSAWPWHKLVRTYREAVAAREKQWS